MKRVKNIYCEMVKIENIKKAIMDCSKGKRKRKDVKRVLNNIDYYAKILQDMLINETFKPTKVQPKKVIDKGSNKERIIYPPKFFPDQCIHWCLINATKDKVFMKGIYKYTCSNIPNRGTSYAVKYMKKILRVDRRTNRFDKDTKYCLYIDIKHFYENINHNILIDKLKRKIKDKQVINLFSIIIKSIDKGLPLGNYTSQWLANFYLQDFDHYIKEILHVKYYCRYADDIVILGRSKKKLHKIRKCIQKYLKNNCDLIIKSNYQVFPIEKRGIDFLGYVFHHDYVLMRDRNFIKIVRNTNILDREFYQYGKYSLHYSCALISRNGLMNLGNHHNIFKSYINEFMINSCKEVIRERSRVNKT